MAIMIENNGSPDDFDGLPAGHPKNPFGHM